MTCVRSSARPAVGAILVYMSACTLPVLAAACTWSGPEALGNGRAAYNAIINETEDQQVLSMIVRHRYDETFGMLAVASVTASLRIAVSAGANMGIGPRSGYEGNLVPLSAGFAFEENPTISYVPMRGEEFLQRMLAPVSPTQALLLSRMSTEQVEVLRLLARRVNGLVNPLYATRPGAVSRDGFDLFVDLQARLRDQGKLDIVQTPTDGFQLLVHDHTEDDRATIDELLRTVGVVRDAAGPGPIAVPLRFFVGAARTDGIDVETPSALEVIGIAAASVQVPEEHLREGYARAFPPRSRPAFLTIRSSSQRPNHAAVAVLHHGSWFFVDARDTRSKQAFVLLRTLIGLRLNDPSSTAGAPVLTIPVSR